MEGHILPRTRTEAVWDPLDRERNKKQKHPKKSFGKALKDPGELLPCVFVDSGLLHGTTQYILVINAKLELFVEVVINKFAREWNILHVVQKLNESKLVWYVTRSFTKMIYSSKRIYFQLCTLYLKLQLLPLSQHLPKQRWKDMNSTISDSVRRTFDGKINRFSSLKSL